MGVPDVPDIKEGTCQMQCGLILMRPSAAGGHIGSETRMGKEPQPAQALYGVASDVTFIPEESRESTSSSAEDKVGEEVASVTGVPGPETRMGELTKLPASFPAQSLTAASLLPHAIRFPLPTLHCTCQEPGKAVPQGH